jgi:tetratricopeptide (TPR) repeat protein
VILDASSAEQLASSALARGDEEAAIPTVRAAADNLRDARLWQWTGVLQRSLDEHEDALVSFAEAARLAPDDASIAHGHARVTMEAGLNAVDLYLRARALAPGNGAVSIGLAAARNSIGDGETAVTELHAALEHAPDWLEGHVQLGQLLATVGRRELATRSVQEALTRYPAHEGLWRTLFEMRLQARAFEQLRVDLRHARERGYRGPALAAYEAVAAAELDDEIFPPALFNGAAPDLAVWRVRHLFRVGAIREAATIVEGELASDGSAAIWPYASLVWRLLDDPRWKWLEGGMHPIATFDLTSELPPPGRLASLLRSLHVAKGEYIDQSVRGGTQTDGPLFSRVDPDIRTVRAAASNAVREYLAELPETEAGHPLLRHARDRRVRFSGSWSVRLRGRGHHSNHVHPQGWISSALYISLPEKTPNESDDAGWLTLGEADNDLGLDLPPSRKIEPKVGQLVLFPSWMWHGTRPFPEGERLTVAFDIQPPL